MTASSLIHDVAAELAGSFSGEVLRPGDIGYEDARKVHNGLVDKRPALIARCRGTADVVDAVKFARKPGLEVAVRGGGHNVAGRATIDDGLMIDLTPMKAIYVDPKRRTGPGARGRDLGRSQSRNATAWARGYRRRRLDNWDSRPHTRWRPWLVDEQVRLGPRQSSIGRAGNR